jgi:WD40 repeat protein
VQYVGVLTFHPDGSLLASYGWDGQLLLWNPSSGRLLLRLTSVSTPKFSPDGRWLGVAWHGDSADLLEVTPTREYRTLVSSAGTGTRSYNTGDFSPDGHLLVVGMDEGARVWDLRSGRELAALPAGTPYASFECGRPGALLTCGSDGLLRWPITCDDPEGGRLKLGPPQPLSDRRRAWFAHGPDGHTLGAVTIEGGSSTILNLQTGKVRRELGIHPRGEVRALSGDGRWAASCGWHSDRVRLWDVASGRMVRQWMVGPQTVTTFSPDSRALIIARGDEFSFWDVETLQRIRRLRRDVTQYPGWVGFSPDGRLMALEMAPGVLHLKDVTTGRTVARLEDPHGDRATWQGFTPDGTRLVVITSYDGAIHVWDLRAIRARLKEMGLDWDWPELPPESPGDLADQGVTIEVIPGDRIRPASSREQRAREAIARGRRTWEANPDSAQACNNLAWIELTAPEGLRDVAAALPLAEKAVRLAPRDATFGNTLGVAYYRACRYRDAVEVLYSNVARQSDRFLAFDLYFLAMSHHHLGDAAEARAYYDWAVRWVGAQHDLNAGYLEELATFRIEAEELLGIERKTN